MKKMKMKRKRKQLRDSVVKISEGVLSKSTDLVLAFLFFNLEYALGFSPTSRGAWRAFHRAETDLENINYQTIKRSLDHLRRTGLIATLGKGGRLKVKITRAGKKRLASLMPVYDEERVWDGKLYLVIYDIVEEKKADRELLREYLKKIGGGMLQKSVWLTVYDPAEVLREFIESRGLRASVLVSCVGKDGHIGQESLADVVSHVFALGQLNRRYQEYLATYSGRKNFVKSAAVFDFLSILRDDPQLPFSLLPRDWAGEAAYQLFVKISTT